MSYYRTRKKKKNLRERQTRVRADGGHKWSPGVERRLEYALGYRKINGLASSTLDIHPTDIPDIDLCLRLHSATDQSSLRMPGRHHLSTEIIRALKAKSQDRMVQLQAIVVDGELVACRCMTDQKQIRIPRINGNIVDTASFLVLVF